MPLSYGPADIRSDLLYHTATAPAGQPLVYNHSNGGSIEIHTTGSTEPKSNAYVRSVAAARAPQPSFEEAWEKATVAGAQLLIAEAVEREARKREAEKKAESQHKMRELQKKQSDMDKERRETLKADRAAAAQKKKQVMAEANRRVQEQKKAREEEEWRKVFEKCKADKEKAEWDKKKEQEFRLIQKFNAEQALLIQALDEAKKNGEPLDHLPMLDWIARVEASGTPRAHTPEQWASLKDAFEKAAALQRECAKDNQGPGPISQGRGGGKGRGRGRGRGLAVASGRGGGTSPGKQPEPPAPEPKHNDDAVQAQQSEEREAVRRAQEERYKALKAAATTATTATASSSDSPPAAPPQASAEGNNNDECVICWNATATHVVVPCGHLCMCPDCVPKELESCPVCRGPMAHVMKVYRP